jgi:hypothetical protein
MPIAIGGISVPDSKLAREIAELVRDTESPLLFHHSSRVFYWGALTGVRRGVTFDAELLYAGAMFHDMGLTYRHSSPNERFEVDGANAARDFLRGHGISQQDIDTVWTAIALHTTPGIPQHMHPVIALVTAGVEDGRAGHRLLRIPRRRAGGGGAGASAQQPFQGRHYPGLLRRHQAKAAHHLWQRQGRRARRQGSALHAQQFLQRNPRLRLARLSIHRHRQQPRS